MPITNKEKTVKPKVARPRKTKIIEPAVEAAEIAVKEPSEETAVIGKALNRKIKPTEIADKTKVPVAAKKRKKPALREDDLEEAAKEYAMSRDRSISSRQEEKDIYISKMKKRAPAAKDSRMEMMPETEIKKIRSIGLYKKISYFFGFLTLALVAAVLYFTFVRVDIMLIPTQERVSNNLIFDVYDQEKNKDLRQGAIGGVVSEVEAAESRKYETSGSEIIGEEVIGKVSIINNYNKSQTLVATTRLLSADNKLFRIKNTITVPAGSAVEAEIYADKAGPDMAIDGAMKWTIPGLWAGMQDKIYGESKEAVKYQQKVKKIIAQSDIDNAVKESRASLLAKAKTEINALYKGYDQILSNIDESAVEVNIDSKVGKEAESFNIDMKTKVRVVAFKDEQTIKMAKDKINSTIPEKKELINFEDGKIVYSLNSYNFDQGVATVNATFEGKITLKQDAVIVEKEKIIGLNKEQLNEYLASLPELAGSEVRFFPSFISKVPDLVDRINIEIKR